MTGSEFTVYDSEKGDTVLVRADTWKQAVRRGAELKGLMPRSHLDVRPRTGTGVSPSRKEFERFVGECL